MIKHRLLSFAFALITTCFATTAEARRGGGADMQEFLTFVTGINAAEGSSTHGLALCHLIERHSIVTIPLYYVSVGYVLSDSNCTTDSYYKMAEGQLTVMKATGAIPPAVPDQPQLTMKQQMTSVFWIALIAVVAGFFLIQKFVHGPHRQRRTSLQYPPAPSQRQVVFEDYAAPSMDELHALLMIEVMCHIARQDFPLEEAEVQRIITIAQRFLSARFDPPRLRRMIESARQNLTPRQFQEMTPNLTSAQKADVMRAALLIAGADQQMEPSAQTLLRTFGSILSIAPADRDRMVTDLSRLAPA